MASHQVAAGHQVVSFAKITATGDAGTADLGVCYSKFSMQTKVTGAPTAVSAARLAAHYAAA